jgi:aryl-alcohol dehydrogenase-like predicted oxidoreductase
MDEILPVAESHNATLAQTIIAWTLQQPGITFSLCGARNADQARENAQAGRLRLTPDDIAKITNTAGQHLQNLDG